MGKSVSIANDSPIPQIYKFIVSGMGMYIHPELPQNRAERVFTLDCPTLDRLGKIQGIIPEDAIIINIDHHISNEHFGKINWVSEKMCATGEIILHLLKGGNIDITPDMATALYVAMVTNTGWCTHSNSTLKSRGPAEILLVPGARHVEI